MPNSGLQPPIIEEWGGKEEIWPDQANVQDFPGEHNISRNPCSFTEAVFRPEGCAPLFYSGDLPVCRFCSAELQNLNSKEQQWSMTVNI